jgi:hypothetical protein
MLGQRNCMQKTLLNPVYKKSPEVANLRTTNRMISCYLGKEVGVGHDYN